MNIETYRKEIIEYDIQLHPVYEVGTSKPKFITVCVWEIKKEEKREIKTLIESYDYIEAVKGGK